MMGVEAPPQGKLYYTNFNLEQRIRPNYPVRRIDQPIDFGFVYQEVADKYGFNGNVSAPPSSSSSCCSWCSIMSDPGERSCP